MGTLSLRRCHFVLTHLLKDRRPELRRLQSGPLHTATLEALSAEVDAALRRRAVVPKADAVRDLVREHIQLIGTLAKGLDAERGNPLTDEARRAAAAVIYAEVVAGRMGPAHPAVARMDAADAIRRLLPALAPELAQLPPMIGALIDRWIAVGEAIGRALAAREAPPEDDALGLVRNVMRALGRLRRAIRLESELTGDLPPDTEVKLLGFADWLQRAPAARAKPVANAPREAPQAADAPVSRPSAAEPASPAADEPVHDPVRPTEGERVLRFDRVRGVAGVGRGPRRLLRRGPGGTRRPVVWRGGPWGSGVWGGGRGPGWAGRRAQRAQKNWTS